MGEFNLLTIDSHWYLVSYSKNICGEKPLANYSISPSFFANFYNFHNIPYANGLQFPKVFTSKVFYYTVL